MSSAAEAELIRRRVMQQLRGSALVGGRWCPEWNEGKMPNATKVRRALAKKGATLKAAPVKRSAGTRARTSVGEEDLAELFEAIAPKRKARAPALAPLTPSELRKVERMGGVTYRTSPADRALYERATALASSAIKKEFARKKARLAGSALVGGKSAEARARKAERRGEQLASRGVDRSAVEKNALIRDLAAMREKLAACDEYEKLSWTYHDTKEAEIKELKEALQMCKAAAKAPTQSKVDALVEDAAPVLAKHADSILSGLASAGKSVWKSLFGKDTKKGGAMVGGGRSAYVTFLKRLAKKKGVTYGEAMQMASNAPGGWKALAARGSSFY
jgi:hypothetical protein